MPSKSQEWNWLCFYILPCKLSCNITSNTKTMLKLCSFITRLGENKRFQSLDLDESCTFKSHKYKRFKVKPGFIVKSPNFISFLSFWFCNQHFLENFVWLCAWYGMTFCMVWLYFYYLLYPDRKCIVRSCFIYLLHCTIPESKYSSWWKLSE